MEIFITIVASVGVTVLFFYLKDYRAKKKREKEMQDAEIERCLKSPHYYFSTYWTIGDKRVRIEMREEEFNNKFFDMMRPLTWKQSEPRIKV